MQLFDTIAIMIKAVIIDFDDTLCMTEQSCFELENDILTKMGRPHQSREIHRATWGKPLFSVIEERSPGVDVSEFRKLYNQNLPLYIKSGYLDDIPIENLETLDKIIALGKKLLILTSREKSELKHLLNPDHVLANRVEAFYYKENMQYRKSDPRAFEQIEKNQGWKSQECIYVGDSPADAAAAKGAGLHFVASLESGLRSEKDFADYPVDVFIRKFPDLVEAIHKLEVL